MIPEEEEDLENDGMDEDTDLVYHTFGNFVSLQVMEKMDVFDVLHVLHWTVCQGNVLQKRLVMS